MANRGDRFEQRVRELKEAGHSVQAIARLLSVSEGKVLEAYPGAVRWPRPKLKELIESLGACEVEVGTESGWIRVHLDRFSPVLRTDSMELVLDIEKIDSAFVIDSSGINFLNRRGRLVFRIHR
jgi:hypothetical protein